ncbi:MAG: response regulator [Leptospiraceae bacterium]|nr:response regulator [Leptospiraceae bacterium]
MKGFSRPMQVLVAEDNSTNQLILQQLLEMWGCVPYLASEGEQACELARHQNFDLILMDTEMPGVDGLSATRTIRSFNPQIPIIAVTAHVRPEDRQRCLDAGMNAHIAKPIDFAILHQLIHRLVPRF